MKFRAVDPDEMKKFFYYDYDRDTLIRISTGEPPKIFDEADGRARIYVGSVKYVRARVIWAVCKGEDPGNHQIDHESRDQTDDRIGNLRKATSLQNLWNRQTVNKSTGVKFVQVSKRNKAKPFEVRIWHEGKRRNLGCYATLDEAALVARKFVEEHRGEFGYHGQGQDAELRQGEQVARSAGAGGAPDGAQPGASEGDPRGQGQEGRRQGSPPCWGTPDWFFGQGANEGGEPSLQQAHPA